MSSALNLKVMVLSFVEGNKYDLLLHSSSYPSDINSVAGIILFTVMIIETIASVVLIVVILVIEVVTVLVLVVFIILLVVF